MLQEFRSALRRFAGVSEGGTDFDAAFYRLNHQDLAHLTTKKELQQHFLKHGRQEGRHTSLASARAHYRSIGRSLPPDFNVAAYRVLNPDLQQKLTTNSHYERHYLEHGEAEGRPYKGEEEDDCLWRTLFDYGEFRLHSAAWRSREPTSRADAMRLFVEEGIERLVPLATDHAFDPAFYRLQYAVGSTDAVALYRDWLERGLGLGHAPNERQAVRRFLGGKPYPRCLDWRGLDTVDPKAPTYPAKIEALQRLFSEDPRRYRRHVADRGAAELYKDIGDHHRSTGADALALVAYDLAIEAGGSTAAHHHHRGDVRRHLAHIPEAIADYRKAMEFPTHSVWAVHHATTLMQEQPTAPTPADRVSSPAPARDAAAGEDDVASLLEAAYAAHAGDVTYRKLVDRIVERRFQDTTAAMMSLVAEGKPDKANEVADRDLPSLASLIASLKLRGLRRIEPVGRRVAMLACLDLPQCTHYRVRQKQEQLAAHGVAVDVADLNDPAAFMRTLPGASAAIFYRVPASPEIMEAILYARSLGILTYYDIDDLVFTMDFPDTLGSYEGQVSRDEYLGLQHGVGLRRNAIRLCDYGIASTRPLADALGPLVRAKIAHVVPNGLDSRSAGAMRFGALPRPAGDGVTIFYGSGTRAHNQDFTDLVAPALLELLASHPTLRFILVGHLALGQAFDAFRDRIDRYPFIEDFEKYWALLSLGDINIAVLSEGASPIARARSSGSRRPRSESRRCCRRRQPTGTCSRPPSTRSSRRDRRIGKGNSSP